LKPLNWLDSANILLCFIKVSGVIQRPENYKCSLVLESLRYDGSNLLAFTEEKSECSKLTDGLVGMTPNG